jgi:hypothetical protein
MTKTYLFRPGWESLYSVQLNGELARAFEATFEDSYVFESKGRTKGVTLS